jgi:hypothetical protein
MRLRSIAFGAISSSGSLVHRRFPVKPPLAAWRHFLRVFAPGWASKQLLLIGICFWVSKLRNRRDAVKLGAGVQFFFGSTALKPAFPPPRNKTLGAILTENTNHTYIHAYILLRLVGRSRSGFQKPAEAPAGQGHEAEQGEQHQGGLQEARSHSIQIKGGFGQSGELRGAFDFRPREVPAQAVRVRPGQLETVHFDLGEHAVHMQERQRDLAGEHRARRVLGKRRDLGVFFVGFKKRWLLQFPPDIGGWGTVAGVKRGAEDGRAILHDNELQKPCGPAGGRQTAEAGKHRTEEPQVGTGVAGGFHFGAVESLGRIACSAAISKRYERQGLLASAEGQVCHISSWWL